MMDDTDVPAGRVHPDDPFIDGTALVDDLIADETLRPWVEEISERMVAADRTHAMTLATVRRAAGLTQTEIARRVGTSQAAVARLEKREDILLSTLRTYLAAAGAQATILVRLADGQVAEISLAQAAD